MEPRSVAQSRTLFSQMMMPDDANPTGNVHGGTIAKLVDSTGAVAAIRHSRGHGHAVVTARIEAMNFVQVVHVGDVVTLRAEVNDVGRTSMEVTVVVDAEDMRSGVVKHVATAYLVYVALDEHERPTSVPPLLVETDEERVQQAAARARREARQRSR